MPIAAFSHCLQSAWPRAAFAASALSLAFAAPAGAQNFQQFFNGVVGGMIGQAARPPQPQYYQPQPQYYQPQPQYHQPQYDQSHRNSGSNTASTAARKKKDDDDKQKQQDAAAATQAAAAAGGFDVPMTRKNGNLWVPAKINNVVSIDFVIDSGASDITLPRDVYLTLIRSGTLTKANYIGNVNFDIADGSQVKGVKFKLASLQVGNNLLHDIEASVMPSDSAMPLLGLSFLSRFQSWSVDNNSGLLKLVPVGAPAAAPVQTAAATPQTLPDLPSAPAAAGAPPAAQTAALATTAPVSGSPQAAPAPTPAANAAPALQAAATVTATPQPSAPTPQSIVPTATATAPSSIPAPAAQVVPAPAVPTVQPAQPASSGQLANALDAPRTGRGNSAVFLATQSAPATPAPAASPAKVETSPIPVFPANTPYSNARTGLIALGYGPAPLPDAGKCDSTTDATCFPERMQCLKADAVQCDFLWRRGEQVIKVHTVAIPPTISAVECQVNCN